MVKVVKLGLRWWRGLLGVTLTFFIVVPYLMGSDGEKYLRDWIESFNQPQAKVHLTLQHYQRHWFTSDAEVLITGKSFKPTPSHLHIFHGPLFLKTGQGVRFGLAFIQANIDVSPWMQDQAIFRMNGPVQVTAFIPYFKEREFRTSLPLITLRDNKNQKIYVLQNIKGNVDSDGLIQMRIPALQINDLNGNTLLAARNNLLRLFYRQSLANFSAKQILIYKNKNNVSTIDDFNLNGDIATSSDTKQVSLKIHFDQLNGVPFIHIGPFQFKMKIAGLQTQGLLTVLETLKTLSTQENDLTPEQGELLQKGFSTILSERTQLGLETDLSTSNGKMSASFQGGFKPQTGVDWIDTFFGQGNIHLAKGIHQALTVYAKIDPEISLLLDQLKPHAEEYTSKIQIKAGNIHFTS